MNEIGTYHFRGVWIAAEIWHDSSLSWMEKILLVEIDQLDGGDGCADDEKYFADFLNIDVVELTKIFEHLEALDLIGRTEGDSEVRLFRKHLRTGPMPPLNQSNQKSKGKIKKATSRDDRRITIRLARDSSMVPAAHSAWADDVRGSEIEKDPLRPTKQSKRCKACGSVFESDAELYGHYAVCSKGKPFPEYFKKQVEELRPTAAYNKRSTLALNLEEDS